MVFLNSSLSDWIIFFNYYSSPKIILPKVENGYQLLLSDHQFVNEHYFLQFSQQFQGKLQSLKMPLSLQHYSSILFFISVSKILSTKFTIKDITFSIRSNLREKETKLISDNISLSTRNPFQNKILMILLSNCDHIINLPFYFIKDFEAKAVSYDNHIINTFKINTRFSKNHVGKEISKFQTSTKTHSHLLSNCTTSMSLVYWK